MFVSTQVTLGVLDLVTSCSIAAEQLLAFPTVVNSLSNGYQSENSIGKIWKQCTVNFYNVGYLWHCSWNGCSKVLMKLSDL
jgi:hypothetical protein